MAVSKKKIKEIESSPTRNYDHNPYWSSSLFNEVYLRNDIPKKYPQWEDDEIGNFYNFYEGFKNLIAELEEHKESFKSWNESDTITNWIRPVMSLLGWEDYKNRNKNFVINNASFTIQEDSKTKAYRPDLLYFLDPSHKQYIQEAPKPEDKLREARGKHGAKIVLEAKYWGRLEEYRAGKILDKKRNSGAHQDETSRSLTPEDQTLKYMDILKHDFGILSDGRTWKLFHKELSKDTIKRCFEFDLGSLIELDLFKKENEFKENIKYFYWFFSKEGLLKTNGKLPFAFDVLEYSQKYADDIEEDLKEKFILSMGYMCNGINENLKKSNKEINLNLIRDIAESHLFNILFIKSCEIRKILPLENTDYYKISLTEIIESLDHMEFDPDKGLEIYLKWFKKQFKDDNFSYQGFDIYNRLLDLYEIVQSGRKNKDDYGFEILGFKESVFSKEEREAEKKFKIDNKSMLLSLFNLSFTRSDNLIRKYQQIPYNYFTPRQLGSIYESFLEFKLNIAEMDMIFHKNKWQKASLNSRTVVSLHKSDEHIAKKGSLFFSESEERRMTGSYYTPKHVVDYMIQKCLGNLKEMDTAETILKIKVCDPAMGSGHFLISVLEFLTNKYREKVTEETLDDLNETWQETAKKILNHCIYGVDINPRAVKLSKLSFWLNTSSPGCELKDLSDRLKVGNSILPKSLLSREEREKWPKAFDWEKFPLGDLCIIGNPPWGASISDITKKKIAEIFDLDRDNLNVFEAFLLLPNLLKNKKTIFIIPRNFVRTDGYTNSRKKLLNHQNLISIIDFGNCFKGVTTEAVALEYSLTEKPKNGIELIPFAKIENFKVQGYLDQEKVLKDPSGNRLNLCYKKELEMIAKKIEFKALPLSDFVDHFRGIEYGKNGEITACKICGQFNTLPKKKQKVKKCTNCGNSINLETSKVYQFISKVKDSKHTVPIVVGKEISKYKCNRFYFMEPNLKGVNYKENAFRNEEKILLMKISDELKGYLDSDNCFTTQGIYMLYLKPGLRDRISLATLLAIINSIALKFYYQYKINMGATLTTNVVIEDILKLPTPNLSLLKELELKNISSKVKKIQSLMKKKFLDTQENQMLNNLKNSIQGLVFQIYGINSEEKIEIDKFLDNLKEAA